MAASYPRGKAFNKKMAFRIALYLKGQKIYALLKRA